MGPFFCTVGVAVVLIVLGATAAWLLNAVDSWWYWRNRRG
jgi:hypothetical protein